jgi:hypothetical protein
MATPAPGIFLETRQELLNRLASTVDQLGKLKMQLGAHGSARDGNGRSGARLRVPGSASSSSPCACPEPGWLPAVTPVPAARHARQTAARTRPTREPTTAVATAITTTPKVTSTLSPLKWPKSSLVDGNVSPAGHITPLKSKDLV